LTNKILTLSKLENHKLEMNKKKISKGFGLTVIRN
jgi:hypothetical protein